MSTIATSGLDEGSGDTTNSTDSSATQLSCAICFERYTKNVRAPISLNCGHTFCKRCVSQLNSVTDELGAPQHSSRFTLICGTCRAMTYSTHNRLKKNILLFELLSEKNEIEETDDEGESDQNPASTNVQNMFNQTNGATRNHNLTSMDVIQRGAVAEMWHILNQAESSLSELRSLQIPPCPQIRDFSTQVSKIHRTIHGLEDKSDVLNGQFVEEMRKLTHLIDSMNEFYQEVITSNLPPTNSSTRLNDILSEFSVPGNGGWDELDDNELGQWVELTDNQENNENSAELIDDFVDHINYGWESPETPATVQIERGHNWEVSSWGRDSDFENHPPAVAVTPSSTTSISISFSFGTNMQHQRQRDNNAHTVNVGNHSRQDLNRRNSNRERENNNRSWAQNNHQDSRHHQNAHRYGSQNRRPVVGRSVVGHPYTGTGNRNDSNLVASGRNNNPQHFARPGRGRNGAYSRQQPATNITMPHHHHYSHVSEMPNNQRQRPSTNMPTTHSQMLHQQERSTGHTANDNNASSSSGHHVGNINDFLQFLASQSCARTIIGPVGPGSTPAMCQTLSNVRLATTDEGIRNQSTVNSRPYLGR